MDRPRYLYRSASDGKAYPCWPVWYREQHPIKKHFRVLDCEDTYDSDDHYKLELNIRSDPAYTEYISPSEAQRRKYQMRAHARAQAIVREIETYKQNAVWRKRLTRAKNEFEFVWQPYEQGLRNKYGWDWRWYLEEKRYRDEMSADLQRKRQQWLEEQARFRAEHPIYGPDDRARDQGYIKRTMQWVDAFDNPYFTRIIVKIVDEQKDIRDQVKLLKRIEITAKQGRLQPLLEELNRRAGLYVAT